jgi:hypothetical protein
MSQHRDVLSRAQLIGGIFATGALAACGGGAPPRSPNIAPQCGVTPASISVLANGALVNEIFSDPLFKDLDKEALVERYDPSAQIEVLHQGYFAQAGRRAQIGNVISSIPSAGIVIQTPGTYTFGRDIEWSPNDTQCAAIAIQCSGVTLDLAGFALTVYGADKSRQITGILVGVANGPAITNVKIGNGTVANAPEYGILAKNVDALSISRITVTGVCMQNLCTRLLTPAGIQVTGSTNVSISGCTVKNLNVTTDSCAGIALLNTNQATVSGCSASSLVNNDGAVQGFSYINCSDVTTTGCTAQSLQSHFNGNLKATGHTVLGFCPIFCLNLSYVNCSASGLTGCCDDCHGMSVFLDGQVTVSGFKADNVTDGVAPSNSGAKATGLEVYGVGVTVTDSAVNFIKAINPQDKQATGFSAWGLLIEFNRCTASNVTVRDDFNSGSHAEGFGWAPDPRPVFRNIGAVSVTYTDCTADHCQVGFDTWNHVNSTWSNPTYTSCGTGILVEPGGTRVLSCDPCSECNPEFSVTLTNMASGNTYPQ